MDEMMKVEQNMSHRGSTKAEIEAGSYENNINKNGRNQPAGPASGGSHDFD